MKVKLNSQSDCWLSSQLQPARNRMDQMKRSRAVWLIALILVLCGCASLPPIVPKSSEPDPKAGYLVGNFSRIDTGAGFGFVLKNLTSGSSITFPMGVGTYEELLNARSLVVAIKVPPGKYIVSEWITYNVLTRSVLTQGSVQDSSISEPFDVEAGSATHLGSYELHTAHTGGLSQLTITWSLRPVRIALDQARHSFTKAYPSFEAIPFTCQPCLDKPVRGI